MALDYANKLSQYFSALCRAEFSADTLAQINRLNATPEYQFACATHDFTDSNALIFGAFCALFFRVPDFTSDSDLALINRAWDLSRANGFA